jgi:outer membrane protein assembly factor BamB
MDPLYVGIKGRVLALDGSTGEVIWETRLKGGQMVTMLVEQNRIFASTQGEVFCLDRRSGAQIWRNNLPGMGWNLVCLATLTNNNSLGLQQQGFKKKQDDAAAAGA